MDNITNNNEITRSVQAGGYYCKVCGYTNKSRLNVMGHVASKHPLDWFCNQKTGDRLFRGGL